MRRLLLALVGVILATTGAVAQISIQVRVPKENFLVYEAIPVTVSIRNFSGRTVQLEDNGDQPWLSFIVTGDANTYVPSTGARVSSEPALVPPGETISQTIDLLPLFQIRSRGSYQVAASIRTSAINVTSSAARLTLMKGREIWTQTVGLPSAPDGGREDYCTYTLVGRRDGSEEMLYVSVRDDSEKISYSLVPLGRMLPTGDPQVKLDKNGCMHVLYQNAPRSYGYIKVDSFARPTGMAAYSDFTTRPELVNRDGVVRVAGGEQTYPAPEHILSEDELNPPPPPPKPKPKKKWYWPFGS